jgi:hypothetical protein
MHLVICITVIKFNKKAKPKAIRVGQTIKNYYEKKIFTFVCEYLY